MWKKSQPKRAETWLEYIPDECPVCLGAMEERHCKLVCPKCGNQITCEDV